MRNSEISWTDSTFNPWIGCTKVSAGCKHCYAETYGKRFGVTWGPTGERKKTSQTYWKQPLTWNRTAFVQCDTCGWRGSKSGKAWCPNCGGSACTPTRQRVFCASLADVFEDRPELTEWRAELFRLIRDTPNLDWLVLTKRPENITPMLTTPSANGEAIAQWGEVIPNLWLGTSVEDQANANKRVLPLLFATGSAVKFLSCEPLLGPVDLTGIPSYEGRHTYNALTGLGPISLESGLPTYGGPYISWVIVGGESGPHARPMHPGWAQSLRGQCVTAKVPFFFKQWGEHLPRGQQNAEGIEAHLYAAGVEAFGGNPPPRSISWASDLWAYKVGKEMAGNRLDGHVYQDWPKSSRSS